MMMLLLVLSGVVAQQELCLPRVTAGGWHVPQGNPHPDYQNFTGNLYQRYWNDPTYIHDASSGDYLMWITSTCEPNTFADLTCGVMPYLGTSSSPEGPYTIVDTPVLTPGPNAFDLLSCETPSVVLFRGTYHMYYTAVPDPATGGRMSIGHATASTPAGPWTKVGNTSLLVHAETITDWNGFAVAEPGAVVFEDKIYLFFTAVGGTRAPAEPSTGYSIGLVVCSDTDGHTFGPQTEVLVQNQTMYPDADKWLGYSTPSALVIDGRIHVFHDLYSYDTFDGEDRQLQIGTAHAYAIEGDGSESGFAQCGPLWTLDEVPYYHGDPKYSEMRFGYALHEDDTLRIWVSGQAIDFAASLDTWHFGVSYAEIAYTGVLPGSTATTGAATTASTGSANTTGTTGSTGSTATGTTGTTGSTATGTTGSTGSTGSTATGTTGTTGSTSSTSTASATSTATTSTTGSSTTDASNAASSLPCAILLLLTLVAAANC